MSNIEEAIKNLKNFNEYENAVVLSEDEKEAIEQATSNVLRGIDIESSVLILEKSILNNYIISRGREIILKFATRQILNFIEEYKNKGYLDVMKENMKANMEITKLQKENERLNWNNETLQRELDRIGIDTLNLEKGSSTEDVIAKIREKDKIIDLMADLIYEISKVYPGTVFHALTNNGFDLSKCDGRCSEMFETCKDCIKQCFERKVEDERYI